MIPPHLLPHGRRPSRTIGCHARRPPFQDRPRQPGTDAFEGVEIGSYPTAGPGYGPGPAQPPGRM